MSTSQDKRLEAETIDRLLESGEGEWDPFAEGAYQNLVAEFVRACAPRAGARLLDVGCGTGSFTRRWAALDLQAFGFDLSPAAIAAAGRTGGGPMGFAVADAEQMPIVDESVDIVTFSSVLHHIPDFRPALREAFRVLKPGGHCFAFDPNVLAPMMYLLRHPSSPLYTPEGVSLQERPLLPRVLRRAFEQAGFHTRQHARAALPYRSVGPRWAMPLLPLYNRVDAFLEWSRVARIIGPFIITVGRKEA